MTNYYESKEISKIECGSIDYKPSAIGNIYPVLLHITLTDGVRSAWVGVNIFCIFVGLIISVICVKNRDSRNVINIISTTISSFWVLLMGGIVALALFIGFVQ